MNQTSSDRYRPLPESARELRDAGRTFQQIAAHVGMSESKVRLHLANPPKSPRVWPENAVAEYNGGDNLATLRKRYRCSLSYLSEGLRARGVVMRGRGASIPKGRNKRIARRVAAGKLTLQKIGDQEGLTKERVRQIARDHKVAPRMKRIKRTAQAKRRRQETARRKKAAAKKGALLAAHRLWMDGHSHQTVADRMGAGQRKSAHSAISSARIRNPGLFPLRRPNQWAAVKRQAETP